ncbi:hypothetical protein A0J59_14750 [Cellulosimicrobium sp. I38E]|nr:hypothetical protein A0J59_14750 [Cellulosimicrobium sp. I38E]
MNVLREGQVVMRKLTAWEGPITVVPAEYDGFVVSGEFPTFTLRNDIAPEWFRLVCQSPRLWAQMKSRVVGTVQRRKRLNPDQLLAIELPVPPLSVQQRIADVVGTVDDQIAALDAEAARLSDVLRARRAEVMADPGVPEVRADAAFAILLGRQRSPQRASGPSMTKYLRSANVGYGTLDLDDVMQMDFDQREQETFGLRDGDVLVSEGSASEKAVGMPAMWRAELTGPVCFQNTLLRYRAIDGVSSSGFTHHWCLWAYEAGRFRDAAGGTNIKHIGSTRAGAMPVRLPDISQQELIVRELDAFADVQVAARAESEGLRAVRSSLLSALLSREIEINVAEEVV